MSARLARGESVETALAGRSRPGSGGIRVVADTGRAGGGDFHEDRRERYQERVQHSRN
jgi:hypothetical protein